MKKTDYLGNYYGMEMWGNPIVQTYINDLEEEVYWQDRKYKYLVRSLIIVAILLATCSLLMLWR